MTAETTIRPATGADKDVILALGTLMGFEPGPERDELIGMLDAYFAGDLGPDHHWVVDEGGASGVIGAAYFAPEMMTQGTWNLYFLAVDDAVQGQGRGAALVRHVEDFLRARGERVLLIETSGLGSFERTRAFYRKQGYDEEARIREFYGTGDDKIIFRKAL